MIWVEKVSESEFDGIFRWNGRVIKTDPSYEYSSSPLEAVESAKGVIDTLLDLRREGIQVMDVDEDPK
jgi:hypothetical protein